MNIQVFRNLTPCQQAGSFQSFKVSKNHLQGDLDLEYEDSYIFRNVGTSRRHIPEDLNIYEHCCKNLRCLRLIIRRL
jgi:hypothetical protein